MTIKHYNDLSDLTAAFIDIWFIYVSVIVHSFVTFTQLSTSLSLFLHDRVLFRSMYIHELICNDVIGRILIIVKVYQYYQIFLGIVKTMPKKVKQIPKALHRIITKQSYRLK